jgi:G3E family GTPase
VRKEAGARASRSRAAETDRRETVGGGTERTSPSEDGKNSSARNQRRGRKKQTTANKEAQHRRITIHHTNRRNKITDKKHPEKTAKETMNERTTETNRSRGVVNEEERHAEPSGIGSDGSKIRTRLAV